MGRATSRLISLRLMEYTPFVSFKVDASDVHVRPADLPHGVLLEVEAVDADTERKEHFIQDGSYGHFYFLTCDHRGDVILYLLFHPDEKAVLDDILSQGLDPRRPNWSVMNAWYSHFIRAGPVL